VNVIVLLADFAAQSEGKLTLVGGGWTFTGPQPGPTSLGILIEVPWSEANRRHRAVIELQDPDGNPAQIAGDTVRIESEFEVGRPPGHPAGVAFNVPIALNFGPIPFEPGHRYVWVVTVNGQTEENWRVGFNVRVAPPDETLRMAR
jgi:hypothetical protein